MYVKKVTLIIVLLLLGLTQMWAQTVTVTGVVTDKQTGEPLIGVSVAVKGTVRGSITDLDGKFSISNVSAGEVLSISYTQVSDLAFRQFVHMPVVLPASCCSR